MSKSDNNSLKKRKRTAWTDDDICWLRGELTKQGGAIASVLKEAEALPWFSEHGKENVRKKLQSVKKDLIKKKILREGMVGSEEVGLPAAEQSEIIPDSPEFTTEDQSDSDNSDNETTVQRNDTVMNEDDKHNHHTSYSNESRHFHHSYCSINPWVVTNHPDKFVAIWPFVLPDKKDHLTIEVASNSISINAIFPVPTVEECQNIQADCGLPLLPSFETAQVFSHTYYCPHNITLSTNHVHRVPHGRFTIIVAEKEKKSVLLMDEDAVATDAHQSEVVQGGK